MRLVNPWWDNNYQIQTKCYSTLRMHFYASKQDPDLQLRVKLWPQATNWFSFPTCSCFYLRSPQARTTDTRKFSLSNRQSSHPREMLVCKCLFGIWCQTFFPKKKTDKQEYRIKSPLYQAPTTNLCRGIHVVPALCAEQ